MSCARKKLLDAPNACKINHSNTSSDQLATKSVPREQSLMRRTKNVWDAFLEGVLIVREKTKKYALNVTSDFSSTRKNAWASALKVIEQALTAKNASLRMTIQFSGCLFRFSLSSLSVLQLAVNTARKTFQVSTELFYPSTAC